MICTNDIILCLHYIMDLRIVVFVVLKNLTFWDGWMNVPKFLTDFSINKVAFLLTKSILLCFFALLLIRWGLKSVLLLIEVSVIFLLFGEQKLKAVLEFWVILIFDIVLVSLVLLDAFLDIFNTTNPFFLVVSEKAGFTLPYSADITI